jgi:hypothetical protein
MELDDSYVGSGQELGKSARAQKLVNTYIDGVFIAPKTPMKETITAIKFSNNNTNPTIGKK